MSASLWVLQNDARCPLTAYSGRRKHSGCWQRRLTTSIIPGALCPLGRKTNVTVPVRGLPRCDSNGITKRPTKTNAAFFSKIVRRECQVREDGLHQLSVKNICIYHNLCTIFIEFGALKSRKAQMKTHISFPWLLCTVSTVRRRYSSSIVVENERWRNKACRTRKLTSSTRPGGRPRSQSWGAVCMSWLGSGDWTR